MTVAACYLYRDGRRIEAVPFEAAIVPAIDNEFIWIGLHKPTRDELLLLQTPLWPSRTFHCRRAQLVADAEAQCL